MAKLETIVEEVETRPRKESSRDLGKVGPRIISMGGQSSNPWGTESHVLTCLENFASRIENEENRTNLEDLRKEAEAVLGPEAVDPELGVYNAARLYRFLKINQMDVQDAISMVVVNSNARAEFKMDAKRERLVREDHSFDSFPHAREFFSSLLSAVP